MMRQCNCQFPIITCGNATSSPVLIPVYLASYGIPKLTKFLNSNALSNLLQIHGQAQIHGHPQMHGQTASQCKVKCRINTW